MERGRSFMKKWSKVKKMLEDDCLCETLKGRVKFFNTRYRSAHDRAGRICIPVSYTHLDVYKRQVLQVIGSGRPAEGYSGARLICSRYCLSVQWRIF